MTGSQITSHIPADKCRLCKNFNPSSRWHVCKLGAASPEEPGCRYELKDVHDSGDET
jgi:hypothetical protein